MNKQAKQWWSLVQWARRPGRRYHAGLQRPHVKRNLDLALKVKHCEQASLEKVLRETPGRNSTLRNNSHPPLTAPPGYTWGCYQMWRVNAWLWLPLPTNHSHSYRVHGPCRCPKPPSLSGLLALIQNLIEWGLRRHPQSSCWLPGLPGAKAPGSD